MLKKRNVEKYYLETTETPKGHLTQTRKMSVQPNPKQYHLKKTEAYTLQDKKVQDVYTKVYDVRNTVFQTKQENFLPDSNEAKNTSWLWWR